MAATKRVHPDDTKPVPAERSSAGGIHFVVMCLGIGVVAAFGYLLLSGQDLSIRFVRDHFTTAQTNTTSSDPSSKVSKPEMHLTRESIDLLLNTIDQAIRHKDVDGVLRNIDLDATITVHMKQGTQHQSTTLTREEYGKTLAMGFTFPSANDFTRVNTTVSLASDERSAKVSFKSTETLHQGQREIKVEGEETLIVKIRGNRPVITSLEQIVPGDST